MSKQTSSATKSMDPIVSLCRRRGFIFQSSELYGGINGFWDYGPLGAELKRNLKEAWWQDVVRCPAPGPDGRPIEIVPVDATIIMNPKVWEASGHVGGFSDLMSTCRDCKKLVRYDHIDEMIYESDWGKSLAELCKSGVTVESVKRWGKKTGKKLAPDLALVRKPAETLALLAERLKQGRINGVYDLVSCLAGVKEDDWVQRLAPKGIFQPKPCPFCGGEITEPRPFNLMFKTTTGAVEDPSAVTYLRPETAREFLPSSGMCWIPIGCACRLGLRRSAKRFATRSRHAILRSGRASSSRWKSSSSFIPRRLRSGISTGAILVFAGGSLLVWRART